MVTLEQIPSFYRDKKVLLTGHTGFKGSWLALWLYHLGARIKGIALAPEEDAPLYHQLEGDSLLDSCIGDIRNLKWLRQEVLSFEPDYIFHLAAQPLVRSGYETPVYTYEANVMGTIHLLESVRSLPGACQVVLVTTDKVYENLETDYAYRESDKLGGFDPYSASKACCEIAISSYRNSFFNPGRYSIHKKSVASARAGNVIGGGDRAKDRILPDIVRALEQNHRLSVRNPDAVRPWQHVLEPLAGYLQLGACMQTDPVKFASAYNFGPDESDVLSVRELVQKAFDHWGTAGQFDFPSLPDALHEAGLLRLDSSKARTELGWIPRYNSCEAIRHTLDWYRNAASSPAGFSLNQIESYLNHA